MNKKLKFILKILTISVYIFSIMFLITKTNYIKKISRLNSNNLIEKINIRSSDFYNLK